MAKQAVAKEPKPRARKAKATGANGVSLEEMREYLDSLHDLSDEMEESNATARGAMSRVYDKASDKLGLTKGALKMIYGKERRDRKDAQKAAKMDTGDRDSLEKAAQAFGDNAFGTWLSEQAKRAGSQQNAEE